MGLNESIEANKHDLEAVKQLESKTKLRHQEILEMLARFRIGTQGKDEIPKSHFTKLMSETGVLDPILQESVFKVLGGTGDTLHFRNLVTNVSIISLGTQHQKLELAFNGFDIDDDGLLTVEDIAKVLESLHKTFGNTTSNVQCLVQAKSIFKALDTDNDGLVSCSDWCEHASQCPEIARNLSRM